VVAPVRVASAVRRVAAICASGSAGRESHPRACFGIALWSTRDKSWPRPIPFVVVGAEHGLEQVGIGDVQDKSLLALDEADHELAFDIGPSADILKPHGLDLEDQRRIAVFGFEPFRRKSVTVTGHEQILGCGSSAAVNSSRIRPARHAAMRLPRRTGCG
jgi:hypothetical protein